MVSLSRLEQLLGCNPKTEYLLLTILTMIKICSKTRWLNHQWNISLEPWTIIYWCCLVEALFLTFLSITHFVWAVLSEGVSHGSAPDPKRTWIFIWYAITSTKKEYITKNSFDLLIFPYITSFSRCSAVNAVQTTPFSSCGVWKCWWAGKFFDHFFIKLAVGGIAWQMHDGIKACSILSDLLDGDCHEDATLFWNSPWWSISA